MSTLDFVSTSADGLRLANEPLISVTTIIGNLGSHPTVTVPMITCEMLDADWAWDYLEEPAAFFGITMPTRAALQVACQQFAASLPGAASDVAGGPAPALLAVTILLIEADGRSQFVISGIPVRRFDPAPVRVAVSSDRSWPTCRSTDATWRRMAARTTSKGDVDHLTRSLNGDGFVDLVSGQGSNGPALGALVFDHEDGLIGLEDPCPVSVVELMERCGAIRTEMITWPTDSIDPEHASAAWWVSPHFEVRPVEQIGDVHYQVENALPPTFLGRLP